jgi:hypothetical protein
MNSDVLERQRPATVHGAVIAVVVGKNGKINRYAYPTLTCTIHPGLFTATNVALPTMHASGVLSAQAAVSLRPQPEVVILAESMPVGT